MPQQPQKKDFFALLDKATHTQVKGLSKKQGKKKASRYTEKQTRQRKTGDTSEK
mgnify:CR=1 FL=1